MVPYNERLARADVHVAVRLYEKGIVSLGRVASSAALSTGEFIHWLAALNIPVVNYSLARNSTGRVPRVPRSPGDEPPR